MIVVSELLDGSRSYTQSTDGKGDTAKRVYEVTGTDNELVAGNEATIQAPNSITLPNDVRITVESVDVESGGLDDRYIVTVNYSNVPGGDDDDNNGGGGNPSTQPSLYSSSLDTSGGQFLLTYALGETKIFPKDGLQVADADKHCGAINVDEDGRVQGVNVILPQLRISRTVAYPASYFTNTFIDTLTDTTGKVNSNTFFGREPGEVLLTGVQGEDQGQPIITLTFNFVVEKNVTGLSIGGGCGQTQVNGINKGGHEYLWVQYSREAGRYSPITGPRIAYVEKVYESADFSLLAIPGA
jgi:hypothetical protein